MLNSLWVSTTRKNTMLTNASVFPVVQTPFKQRTIEQDHICMFIIQENAPAPYGDRGIPLLELWVCYIAVK